MRFVLLTLVTLMLAISVGCTDPNKAKRVLTQAGYTNIEITGYRWFMKGRDDSQSTGFRATAPNGETVTGAVTSGAFTGATIRLD